MSKCIVKHCQMIGTDMQCKNCPDWDKLIYYNYIKNQWGKTFSVQNLLK